MLTTLTAATPRPEQRPYRPYGAARLLAAAREKEVLVSGPAGTGKSRACLEKLYRAALTFPGMRILIVRKTRAALTETTLVTFERHVVPEGDPLLEGAQRAFRKRYGLFNGTEIVVGGLDKSTKILSSDYDWIYVPEATELSEDDWETLTTRLRNGVAPYQQLLADCNPQAPHHWLKQRCDRGQTLLLESRHEDNPTCTPEYLATLDQLTGVRKERLRYGRWVAAEGIVYPGWDPAFHRIDREPVPAEWPRYWVVDFGYTNPFCWQGWAQDPDGRLYCYRQIYMTGRLVEDHARLIKRETSGEPRPRAVICDHDAEDRATLERHLGLQTTAAYKAVSPGIQAVSTRLRPGGDGHPRLIYLRDSLVERDESLAAAGKPTETEQEFDTYIWDTSSGRRQGEEPVKRDDHGVDATRYLIAHIDRISEDRPNPLAGMIASCGSKGWVARL